MRKHCLFFSLLQTLFALYKCEKGKAPAIERTDASIKGKIWTSNRLTLNRESYHRTAPSKTLTNVMRNAEEKKHGKCQNEKKRKGKIWLAQKKENIRK